MGWGATDNEPDIAEMSGRRNRLPSWTRWVGIVGAVVLVVAALFVVRQFEGELTAVADQPRFSERHLTETDLRIDNPTGETLFVTLEIPERNGLRLREVRTTGTTARSDPPTYTVLGRDEITLTLLWQPTNCTVAMDSARLNDPAKVTVEAGDLVGEKRELPVRLGKWRDLVPPACDDYPDRGVPRLADEPATASSDGLLAIAVVVDNAGGQPLRLIDVQVPEGIDPALIVDVRPRMGTIDIGSQLEVVTRFRQNDCHAPIQGSASIVLRFDTTTTRMIEQLRVPLADSWANLLGTCVGQ